MDWLDKVDMEMDQRYLISILIQCLTYWLFCQISMYPHKLMSQQYMMTPGDRLVATRGSYILIMSYQTVLSKIQNPVGDIIKLNNLGQLVTL